MPSGTRAGILLSDLDVSSQGVDELREGKVSVAKVGDTVIEVGDLFRCMWCVVGMTGRCAHEFLLHFLAQRLRLLQQV